MLLGRVRNRFWQISKVPFYLNHNLVVRIIKTLSKEEYLEFLQNPLEFLSKNKSQIDDSRVTQIELGINKELGRKRLSKNKIRHLEDYTFLHHSIIYKEQQTVLKEEEVEFTKEDIMRVVEYQLKYHEKKAQQCYDSVSDGVRAAFLIHYSIYAYIKQHGLCY